MDFTTLSFLGFLAASAIACRLCPARLRPALILLASYGFYSIYSRKLALLILASTAAAYFAARAIDSKNATPSRRALITATIISAVVGLLVIFKSAPLLPGAFHHLLLPLGISYYTFKLVSYVLDVYWHKALAEKNFTSFAAYIAFFPQIVAGPIHRSEGFLAQVHHLSPPSSAMVLRGVQRIMLGFFKKFIVADNLAILVNFVYGHAYAPGTPIILGFYAFPLQMYADFSGLTDIAIGSACLLGIESPENFNAPFSAVNPSEFWRRWHMSLTTWLRDYVFTPLRVATRDLNKAGLVFSLFVNMILIGLWHGFTPAYALFGALHAFYLSVDALTARARKHFYKLHPSADSITTRVGPVVTFHLVAIAFVFFRGGNLGRILHLLGNIFGGIATPSPEFLALMSVSGRSLLVGAFSYGLIELGDYLRRLNERRDVVQALPRWGRWSVYSCTAVAMLFMALLLLSSGGAHNPFLYELF